MGINAEYMGTTSQNIHIRATSLLAYTYIPYIMAGCDCKDCCSGNCNGGCNCSCCGCGPICMGYNIKCWRTSLENCKKTCAKTAYCRIAEYSTTGTCCTSKYATKATCPGSFT